MASRVEREKCSAGACPQPGPRAQPTGSGGLPQSFRPPNSSFRRSKACPVPRYGAGIQKGEGQPSHISKSNVPIGPPLVGTQNDSHTRETRGLGRPEGEGQPLELCNYPHRTSHRRGKVLFIYELSMMGEVSSVSQF